MTKFDPDKEAADKVRLAVDHLNGTIIAAARRDLHVELDVIEVGAIDSARLTRVTVAISRPI